MAQFVLIEYTIELSFTSHLTLVMTGAQKAVEAVAKTQKDYTSEIEEIRNKSIEGNLF